MRQMMSHARSGRVGAVARTRRQPPRSPTHAQRRVRRVFSEATSCGGPPRRRRPMTRTPVERALQTTLPVQPQRAPTHSVQASPRRLAGSFCSSCSDRRNRRSPLWSTSATRHPSAQPMWASWSGWSSSEAATGSRANVLCLAAPPPHIGCREDKRGRPLRGDGSRRPPQPRSRSSPRGTGHTGRRTRWTSMRMPSSPCAQLRRQLDCSMPLWWTWTAPQSTPTEAARRRGGRANGKRTPPPGFPGTRSTACHARSPRELISSRVTPLWPGSGRNRPAPNRNGRFHASVQKAFTAKFGGGMHARIPSRFGASTLHRNTSVAKVCLGRPHSYQVEDAAERSRTERVEAACPSGQFPLI